MMTIQSIRSVQPLEAVLVANASRARLFDRDAENGAMRETASFVHPQSRMKGRNWAATGRARPSRANPARPTRRPLARTRRKRRRSHANWRNAWGHGADAALFAPGAAGFHPVPG